MKQGSRIFHCARSVFLSNGTLAGYFRGSLSDYTGYSPWTQVTLSYIAPRRTVVHIHWLSHV